MLQQSVAHSCEVSLGEPAVALADWSGLQAGELRELQRVVEEHRDEFIGAWNKHFGG
ncbi:MAG: DUF4160 domain-containing protein [Deltaproteobacteria bacterium]|nr:DUF4160 domain-containing protein [Deltaproteobacteria bacterium]